MNKILGILTFTMALLVFGSVVTYAQDTTKTDQDSVTKERRFRRGGFREGKMRGRKGMMMMRALKQLNLSETQKAQLKTLHENFFNSTKTQREELRQIFETKRNGGTLTTEQETRAREIRAQMKQAQQQLHSEMMNILTPEQKTQLEQMREQMKQRRQERRQTRPTDKEPKDN
jgi:Spy/CpxP family protein refolding chaperone